MCRVGRNLLRCCILLLLRLKGINDKLEVGYGVGGQRVLGSLEQLGIEALDTGFGHTDLIGQQSPDIDIGLQELQP